MVPKKKYRDKVRHRLALVREFLLNDPERLAKMMRRVGGFAEGSDFNNKLTALEMLLTQDVPAILDALDGLNDKQTDA